MDLENIIEIIEGRRYECNTYVLKGEELVLIDPGSADNHDYLIQKLHEKNINISQIKLIVNTHCHYDHGGGNKKLKEFTKAQLAIHSLDATALEQGNSEKTGFKFASNLNYIKDKLGKNEIDTLIIERKLEEGYLINGFKVIHTPGHTSGSICLYNESEKILISGDTIFDANSIGRTDLPSGSSEQLKQSLEKLSELDVEIILPGHGPVILENGTSAILQALEIV
jgi:glyoxylase-like metal-dependent hydrolase (beta-lactamase superfamily II)